MYNMAKTQLQFRLTPEPNGDLGQIVYIDPGAIKRIEYCHRTKLLIVQSVEGNFIFALYDPVNKKSFLKLVKRLGLKYGFALDQAKAVKPRKAGVYYKSDDFNYGW